MMLPLDMLRQKLAHVLWLGGSPCAGKSSIADALAAKYGFALYRCDDAFYQHQQIITPESQPVFHRVMGLSSEALWMRPVEQQFIEEVAIYQEQFPLILQDLLALPDDRPVLVEGAALMPELVSPLLDGRGGAGWQAVWVVPSASFQRDHYSKREWVPGVLEQCSDKAAAFHHWMERDIRFAGYIQETAAARGLPVLVVDGSFSLAESTTRVETLLQISSKR